MAAPRPSSSAGNRYYASNSAKPFSKSAAKRSSVMALGSIAHLQHFYVKHGLANPDRVAGKKFSRSPLVLALPGAQPSALPELDDFDDLPPSPAVPERKPPPPFIELKEPVRRDLREARAEVLGNLDAVCRIWGLVENVRLSRKPSTDSMRVRSPSPNPPSPISSPTRSFHVLPNIPSSNEEPFILNLIHTTTNAIRAVQKYILTLPSEQLQAIQSTGNVRDSLLEVETARQNRFSSGMNISTSARSRSVLVQPTRYSLGSSPLSSGSGRRSFTPGQNLASLKEGVVEEKKEDALTTLRRSSLDVLGSLKDMELRYRLPGQEDLKEEDEEYISSVDPDGESSNSPSAEIGRGYEYRTDVALEDLRKESQEVRKYVELVDYILFRDKDSGKKKRRSEANANIKNNRRQGSLLASFGLSEAQMVEEPEEEGAPDITITEVEGESDEEDEFELPDWAGPAFDGNPLRRAHAVLAAYLSARVIFHLSPPFGDGDRESFLESIHDGTLLCLAYNSALRKSQRPWGFIPPHSIHDILSIDSHQREPTSSSANDKEPARVGLTFRKIENLRVWAAALKLRYLINLSPPPTTSKDKDRPKDAPIVQPPPSFEPKIVARKDVGWENMLEYAVFRWAHALVEETKMEGLA